MVLRERAMLLVAVLLGGSGVACDVPGSPPVAQASAPAPAAAQPSPLDVARGLPDFAAVLQYAFPMMADTRDKLSAGAALTASWLAERGQWADVDAPRDETSIKLALKDSELARAKRLCVTGQLVQISRVHALAAPLYEGTMIGAAGHPVQFLAARSSGELVSGSHARLCGRVTGLYSYANTAGGTAHSVQVVGMFDLPENRAPAVLAR